MQPKESKTNKHFVTSIAKSIIRIMGYIALMHVNNTWIITSAIILTTAEILGIIEEL
jgi:hypothetical protein